ncbi:Mu-like prophage FluMu protein gp41 [Escherichia coli]|nr:Mu-like prophage FluMu protein gp41 [Escherichia coli]
MDLLDGLPFGETREYRVTFRELTAKDSIDAEAEAERVVETNNGPMLIASPSLRGVALLRRQIAAVGDIEGPLSPRQIGQLSERDLSRLMAAVSLLDTALAGKLAADRGDQAQCRDQIEEAAIILGMVTKSGPEWALNLPLSQLYRHCRQTEKIIRTKQ